jgi:L-ascorbate metabolism protein UlaG (beta-lactamase superfamily)
MPRRRHSETSSLDFLGPKLLGFVRLIIHPEWKDNSMRSRLRLLFFVALAAPLCLQSQVRPEVSAYVSSPRRALVAPELPELDEAWVSNSLSWADAMLAAYPPGLPENPARRPVLQRLDDIFHMKSPAESPAVKSFLRTRTDVAITQMEQDRGTKSDQIWKLYNDGFVVRSGGVTVGFDVIPGVPRTGCVISHEQLIRLLAQIDVLFISHEHEDHANREVAELLLAAGKPVIAPPKLWEGQSFAAKLTYPTRDYSKAFSLPVRMYSLSVVVFPGHQGPVLNNIYWVKFPSGFTIVHMGDQGLIPHQGEDRQWLARIGDLYRVNVLLVDCWYADIDELVRNVRPDLVVPGHENELAHSIDHREDYAQTYERLANVSRPFVEMTWGEYLQLDGAQAPRSFIDSKNPQATLPTLRN